MTKAARKDGWLKPQAVYGYFPCQSEGDDLIIYSPLPTGEGAGVREKLTRFSFPRQPHDDHLALSNYFASVESGKLDVVAFQIVTVGLDATERFDRMQAKGDYSEAYFTHGLAVQTAEATADYLHNHIRRELGLGEDQGNRYSWGYPAIPEQSTAAIIVHHKEAKYYSVGESRVEQLMK